MQGHAQHEDGQDAERHRQRERPQHIAGNQHQKLTVGIDQVRRQLATTGGGDLGGNHRQQPHRGHLVDAVLLAGEHQVRNGHAAEQRQPHIEPPHGLDPGHDAFTPAIDAKQQATVEDGGQPHGDGAEEHRYRGMGKNLPRFIEEHQPACGIQHAEQDEQGNGQPPQGFCRTVQAVDADLHQGQGQDPGAHGRGEPVGGELTDDFTRVSQMAQRAQG
ncbi:hypothetical protein D3C84_796240 [compost metagenome]